MNNSVYSIFLLAFLCVFSQTANCEDTPVNPLHELGIKKFEGSQYLKTVVEKYVEIEVSDKQKVKGTVQRFFYKIPEASSSLEISDNFKENLSSASFENVTQTNGGVYEINIRCGALPRSCGFSQSAGQYFDSDQQGRLRGEKVTADGAREYVTIAFSRMKTGSSVKIPLDAKGATGTIDSDQFLMIIDIVTPKDLTKRLVENVDQITAALEREGRINIYGIYFDFNKADIKPESEPVLSNVATVLKSNPLIKLNIIGHTDNIGPDDANLELSLKRATSVVATLTSRHGISQERLKANGRGMTEPIDSNDTEAGRAKNRRVELVKF